MSRIKQLIFFVKPLLKNQSTVKTITNASVRLICADPWVTSILPSIRDLSDIPPGAVIGPSAMFRVDVDTTIFPDYFNFKVEVMSNGWAYWTDSMRVPPIVPGVDEELSVPLAFMLEQNFPNPFNPSTTIKYSILEISKVMLKLFNLLGEEVATLVNEEKVAGYYTVEFNASNLPSGVYFYQLKAGDYIETKKMVLLK